MSTILVCYTNYKIHKTFIQNTFTQNTFILLSKSFSDYLESKVFYSLVFVEDTGVVRSVLYKKQEAMD
jgi:hypothetical protein